MSMIIDERPHPVYNLQKIHKKSIENCLISNYQYSFFSSKRILGIPYGKQPITLKTLKPAKCTAG